MRGVDISLLNFGLAIALLLLAVVLLLTDGSSMVAMALLPVAFANITIGLINRAKRRDGSR